VAVPSKVDLLGGLLAMPKRYMVDLHHVVARDKYMANTHVATAGGFVLAACWRFWCMAWACINRILGYALLWPRR
jgi:dimethylglycine catabolism B